MEAPEKCEATDPTTQSPRVGWMMTFVNDLAEAGCAGASSVPCDSLPDEPMVWCAPCMARREAEQRAEDLATIRIPSRQGKPPPTPVIIETPYAGNLAENERYLRRCIRDSIAQGEAPFASHRMYADALDDGVAIERSIGISAGFSWRSAFKVRTIVYGDLGISEGMRLGIEHARRNGLDVVYRKLDK